MYIQQLYTNCLAEAAYYIESNGEVAIIDPIRETEPYLTLAEQRGAKIKYIFETHFHADFISGHIDLSKKTGAPIIYGPGAKTEYSIVNATDEEVFKLGNISLKVMHTPGHTLESICILIIDEQGKENAVFTGDTLFVGDVGRPDLTGASSTLTSNDLAGFMYDSLQSKIKTLPKETIVYPAHGAGSSCGKNIGKETFTTIGAQLEMNYALQAKSKQEFIELVIDGLNAPPPYFFADAAINKNGYKSIDDILMNDLKSLSLEQTKIENGATILDVRHPDDYEKLNIEGSINIGLDGQFAIWAATLLPLTTPIVIVAPNEREKEAITRLARVGFDNVKGYLLENELMQNQNLLKTQTIESITPQEFASNINDNSKIIDVRNMNEQSSGVLDGAELIELSILPTNSSHLNQNQMYYIHCAGGYRSMIACSILKKQGIKNVINVKGGMAKIKEQEGIKLQVPVI